MHKSFSFLFLICSTFICFGQELSNEYGIVVPSDFTYTYDKAPNAAALILFDKGEGHFETHVDRGREFVLKRQKRIKIVKKGGLHQANIEIKYYKNKNNIERVEGIVGMTYTFENGVLTRTPLKTEEIIEVKINDHEFVKKFAMPKVKEGSLIEYSYLLRSPFITKIDDWYFQDFIPTRSSTFKITLPYSLNYAVIFQEIDSLTTNKKKKEKSQYKWKHGEDYSDVTYLFGLQDIPAFEKDVKLLTSEQDYMKKIKFELASYIDGKGRKSEYSSSWENLIKLLESSNNHGKFISMAEKKCKRLIIEKMPEILEMEETDKFNTILQYVKNNFAWDGIYSFGARKSANDLFKTKSGHSGDINMLTIGMMRAAGFEAYEVANSTRNHGRVFYEYPFWSYFNNSVGVVNIKESPFLFDSTLPKLSNYLIPSNYLNGRGLRIDVDNPSWHLMTSSNTSVIEKNIFLQPNLVSDSVKTSIKASYSHYDAYKLKEICKNDQKCLNGLFKSNGYTLINGAKTQGYESKEEPYRLISSVKIPMNRYKDKILIKPLLNEGINTSFLTAKERTYPVDFNYKKKRKFTSTILVPSDYRVLSIPENISISSELVDFSYKTKTLGSSLQVIASYEFKKSFYEPEYYTELKKDYKTIFDKLKEEVVLVKK